MSHFFASCCRCDPSIVIQDNQGAFYNENVSKPISELIAFHQNEAIGDKSSANADIEECVDMRRILETNSHENMKLIQKREQALLFRDLQRKISWLYRNEDVRKRNEKVLQSKKPKQMLGAHKETRSDSTRLEKQQGDLDRSDTAASLDESREIGVNRYDFADGIGLKNDIEDEDDDDDCFVSRKAFLIQKRVLNFPHSYLNLDESPASIGGNTDSSVDCFKKKLRREILMEDPFLPFKLEETREVIYSARQQMGTLAIINKLNNHRAGFESTSCGDVQVSGSRSRSVNSSEKKGMPESAPTNHLSASSPREVSFMNHPLESAQASQVLALSASILFRPVVSRTNMRKHDDSVLCSSIATMYGAYDISRQRKTLSDGVSSLLHTPTAKAHGRQSKLIPCSYQPDKQLQPLPITESSEGGESNVLTMRFPGEEFSGNAEPQFLQSDMKMEFQKRVRENRRRFFVRVIDEWKKTFNIGTVNSVFDQYRESKWIERLDNITEELSAVDSMVRIDEPTQGSPMHSRLSLLLKRIAEIKQHRNKELADLQQYEMSEFESQQQQERYAAQLRLKVLELKAHARDECSVQKLTSSQNISRSVVHPTDVYQRHTKFYCLKTLCVNKDREAISAQERLARIVTYSH